MQLHKCIPTGSLVAFSLVGALSFWEARENFEIKAWAQSSSSATIDERAAELKAFREKLRSPDEIERAAAFEKGLANSEPIVQKLTMKEGLQSRYADLRTMALRSWIASHDAFIVQLTLPQRPSEATLKMRNMWLGEGLLLERVSVDAKDEITAFHQRTGLRFKGQFTSGGLILMGSGVSNCTIELQLIDEPSLSGSLRCQGSDPIRAKVSVD
jgi:hypothetical protein